MRRAHAPLSPLAITGTLVSVQGATIIARLPQGSVGDLCWIRTRDNREVRGQIVSFQENNFSLALFDEPDGIFPGAHVRTCGSQLAIPVSMSLLGQVISPLGIPLIESSGPIPCSEMRAIHAAPPSPVTRPIISEPLHTGIRSIDGFCALGRGQRIGICASAGIGKSTLLGMIAQHASADVIVVALVGERSREVREFVEDILGASGLARSVVVVATSNDSSLLRQTAPYTATTIAEYFRDQGLNVLLIVDSVTRLARAIRETSIAAGDIPVRHGYTNSVYTQLPRLIERAGTSSTGSISGMYTVLTNTEDDIDPLADEVKSLLDGHITLAREIANLGILPAIDVTQSISRLFERLTTDDRKAIARQLRRAFTRLLKERDIVLLGGTPDRELHAILNHQQSLTKLLSQSRHEFMSQEDIHQGMANVWADIESSIA
jgi:flagellum-specific ATP synthase